MKRLSISLVALLGLFVLPAGCAVADVPADGVGSCDPYTCGQALSSGLSAPGAPICNADSDSAYGGLQACACGGAAPCFDVCGDNLCQDLGETPPCGECLDQRCGPEHATCGKQ